MANYENENRSRGDCPRTRGPGGLRARLQRRTAGIDCEPDGRRAPKPKVHTQVIHRTRHVRAKGGMSASGGSGSSAAPGGDVGVGPDTRARTRPGSGRGAGQQHDLSLPHAHERRRLGLELHQQRRLEHLDPPPTRAAAAPARLGRLGSYGDDGGHEHESEGGGDD